MAPITTIEEYRQRYQHYYYMKNRDRLLEYARKYREKKKALEKAEAERESKDNLKPEAIKSPDKAPRQPKTPRPYRPRIASEDMTERQLAQRNYYEAHREERKRYYKKQYQKNKAARQQYYKEYYLRKKEEKQNGI